MVQHSTLHVVRGMRTTAIAPSQSASCLA